MSVLYNILHAIIGLIEGPLSQAEMETALDKKAAANSEKLDWRNSIVDLMKLVGADSSLSSRERLASELGYQGAYNGSAEMNTFLHQKVMEHLSTSMR